MTDDARAGERRAALTLHWIPLGAGEATGCVRLNGRLYEAAAARRAGRQPAALFHSALVALLDGADPAVHAIEMAPEWSGRGERGVVATGPVGLRALGRSRWFRYEVRCWRDGSIPDVAHATDPVDVPTDGARIRRLVALAPSFPTATWGRDELDTGEMWNSNSLVSWLLAASGHDTSGLTCPAGGRAPGWDAGLVAAARQPGPSRRWAFAG